MKKTIVISILLLSVSFARGQVFIGTEPNENPVILEVKSNNKGVLLPRIDIPNTSDASPVKNPSQGLLVMNIHPGNEGMFFWDGQAWIKLKTVESAIADLQQMGNRSVFVGTTKFDKLKGPAITQNSDLKVSLEVLGVGKDTTYTVSEDGIYEISASFTGDASNANAIIGIYIWLDNISKNIAYTTISQDIRYSEVAAKVVYCGPLNKDDRIELRLKYIPDSSTKNVPQLRTANLSVKKISIN